MLICDDCLIRFKCEKWILAGFVSDSEFCAQLQMLVCDDHFSPYNEIQTANSSLVDCPTQLILYLYFMTNVKVRNMKKYSREICYLLPQVWQISGVALCTTSKCWSMNPHHLQYASTSYAIRIHPKTQLQKNASDSQITIVAKMHPPQNSIALKNASHSQITGKII